MTSKRCLTMAMMGCLMLLSSINLFGQATASASLQGTITDKTGAVISKADVTITNKETGAVRSTKTNDTGEYRFDPLPAGMYNIKTTFSGFTTSEAANVEVLIGRTSTQNFTLSPGSTTETIEVTAVTPFVDQQKTDVSTSITPDQVQELPLIGRDIADLAYLSPGVKAANSYDPTKNRFAILSVNGAGGRNVNVTVNGVDNKDNTVGGPVMQLPAEAVQEFSISTQRFSAVNGRSEGAAINVITKSGSNGIHGSAFGFFRAQALNADQKLPDPAHNTTVSSNPPYSRQWFGGSIGAPLKKDKLFVFFAFERQREHTSLSEAPNALTQLNLVTALGAQPAAIVPTPFFENRINGRMDYTINSRNSVYLAVSTQANNSLNDQSNGTFDLTEGNFTVNHMQLANLSLNSAITPTLVNQFTVGFSYWNNLIDSTTKVPLITFPGAQFGTNTNVPQQSFQGKFQFKDDVTKTIGRHTLKAGADYIWNPKMGGFFESNGTLEIDFIKNPSCILGVAPDAATAGCGAAFFPTGFSSAGAVKGMGISNGDPNFVIPGGTKQIGLYFQDDWKIMRRLNLNLGLRYDKDFNMVGGVDVANSRTFQELLAIAPSNSLAASLTRKKAGDDGNDFSPRIGFAYDITGSGKHVVRGGYGLYYGDVFQNIPLFMEQQSNATVFQALFTLTGTDVVPGTGIPLNTWRFGVDPMPTIAAPSHNLNPGSYRNPVTEEFNAGYAWSLTSKSVFEVEYVHVLSLHENKTINVDPNIPVTPGAITTLTRTGLPGGFFRPLDAAFTAASQPVLGSVRDEQSIGRSRYDGMNFSYRQQAWHNVTMGVNYTLARALTYGGGGGSFRNYPRDPQKPFNLDDFGPSFNDERHHLTISGIWKMPWGMEFAPILQAGSARPYIPVSSNNMLNLGGGSAAGALLVLNSDPNNLLATKSLTTLQQAQCYYSANCHLAPIGNLRGDPFFDVDTRLAKNIKLGERRNLQLAFQAFNLFNHANYGNNFDLTVQDATFAKAVGFINPANSVAPRSFTAEFGARFTF